jgi:four helix bundle protein
MFSFEKLEVYNKAYHANQQVYRFLKNDRNIPFYVKNQLGKACLSIILNIAEGSAKFGKKDRRNFYVIARGSAFECSALLSFLYNEGEVEIDLKNELTNSFEEISNMLYSMIKNLES